jgi:hypothetical protein
VIAWITGALTRATTAAVTTQLTVSVAARFCGRLAVPGDTLAPASCAQAGACASSRQTKDKNTDQALHAILLHVQ